MFKCNTKMNRGLIASIKFATATFVIIVLKLWDGAMVWVHNTNIWWFVGAFVIFVVMAGMKCEGLKNKSKPVKKNTKKKK